MSLETIRPSKSEVDFVKDVSYTVVEGKDATLFGVYVFRSEDIGSELARFVEREVFLEAFGNTREQLALEYEKYESRSVFFCVVDHRRMIPVGAMRVMLPTDSGGNSKTLDDIEGYWGTRRGDLKIRNGEAFPYKDGWDIGTLAVTSDFQGRATAGVVAMGLYHAYTSTAKRCGVDWTIAILDNKLFRFGNWQFKGTWSQFDGLGLQAYLGSLASLPVWCQLSEWESRLHVKDTVLHGLVFRGDGYGPILRPLRPELGAKLVFDVISKPEPTDAIIDLRNRRIASGLSEY